MLNNVKSNQNIFNYYYQYYLNQCIVFIVIDCGFVKLKWFNSKFGADSLITVPISKASAVQRAGRAGRERPGKVYRYMEICNIETVNIMSYSFTHVNYFSDYIQKKHIKI